MSKPNTGSGWRPERDIEIVAGTPPGGGLDRVARALAEVITGAGLLDLPVRVVNIPGDGARRAWSYIDKFRGDAHVVSISSPNLTSDHLVGLADFDYRQYSPIATLVTEYIAFAVRTDSALRNGGDLLARLARDAASLRVALSTARGNPNHVALAKLTRHAQSDIKAPAVRVFDTALDAVADVIAGNADIAAVTAASVLAELGAGRLRLLAISAPARLGPPFADTPSWVEQGVDCVIGAWRGVTGPSGLTTGQLAFWESLLIAATREPAWQAALAKHCWSAMHLDGAALRRYLERERAEMSAVLRQLDLLPGTRQEASGP
jgi:putative tricarboxylic transport membrane protein